MKKRFLLIGLMPMSISVFADGEAYGGIGIQAGTYEQTNTSGFDGADFSAYQLTLGKYLSESNAIEVRLTKGISGEEFTYGGYNQSLKVVSAKSLFFKHDFNITESNKIYPLIGYTEAKFDVDFSDYNVGYTISDLSGFSYGLGFSANISETMKFNAEYISYFSDDKTSVTVDYSSVNAGINIVFD